MEHLTFFYTRHKLLDVGSYEHNNNNENRMTGMWRKHERIVDSQDKNSTAACRTGPDWLINHHSRLNHTICRSLLIFITASSTAGNMATGRQQNTYQRTKNSLQWKHILLCSHTNTNTTEDGCNLEADWSSFHWLKTTASIPDLSSPDIKVPLSKTLNPCYSPKASAKSL